VASEESWQRLINEEMPRARDPLRMQAMTFALYVRARGEVVMSPFVAFKLLGAEDKTPPRSSFAHAVIVHEIVHVLQEQHFRLASRLHDAKNSEQKLVLRSMLEGFATWVEGRAAEDDLGLESYAAENAKRHGANGRMEYVRGRDFFDRVHEAGGYEAVHDAMRNEPLTLVQFTRIALKRPPAAPADAAQPAGPKEPAK
jgi:hypothetical protein